jgi:hypothetical protein
MDYYLIQNGGDRTVIRSDAPVPGANVIPDELVHAVFDCMDAGIPFRLVDGQLELASDLRPSRHATYDWERRAWVDARTLGEMKAQKWAEVRATRDAKEFGGFAWGGSIFDSDAMSQSRIMGAAQLAQLDPGFQIDWTLADNTVRSLSAVDMLAVGVALGAHVAAQHATARELRAQIHAAADHQAVEAVAWPD